MSYKDILKKYWGYDDFRGIQQDIIESIGEGRDTLGLMPTGGGKSITFQVPALAKDGVCIVITPLIALMKDQVDHLKQKGIQAAAIYSGMSRNEIVSTLENCIFGGVKLLYISPERICSDIFQTKLKRINVSFITVDEAHCISQWGYDFRPSYLAIADIRRQLPNIPILALTATATSEVIDDIQDQLLFAKRNVFRMSFERKNLVYIVRRTDDKYSEMIHILKAIPKAAIVYCRNRKRTKEAAELLIKSGISATWYHAGLENTVKDQRQKEWQADKTRVIVATNAFGMGIDKPDVRVVIHIDCPSSIEAYFQEAGRAGRDGKKSYAVLLYNGHDRAKLINRIEETFPPKEYIRQVYDHLSYFFQIGIGSGKGYTFEFPIDKFSFNFKHFPTRVNSALQIIHRAGYIKYDPNPNNIARVHFLLNRDDLYRLDSLSKNENSVVTALLRSYGGLFSDYGFVDESWIAQQAGLDVNKTYMALIDLSKKRIISFIPRHKVPLITYLYDRIDGDDIELSEQVYDIRKEEFTKRIKAVISYAEEDSICRSRQLLRYFSETKTSDCNQCDVCLSNVHKQDKIKSSNIRNKIMVLLSDRKQHLITEIKAIFNDEVTTLNIIEEMLAEEKIIIDGEMISMNI
ncbi:ATP-dependent DNA helicase RecQ [Prevotella amnii]|uniref:RecQ family ATP-dependent DNA helicase n=1 Tax=Prevotella amnii TaxID=419005 RepID=UPI00336AC1E8